MFRDVEIMGIQLELDEVYFNQGSVNLSLRI